MENVENVENQHVEPTRKRPSHVTDEEHVIKLKRHVVASSVINRRLCVPYVEVAGRIAGVELENFMCHGHLKIDFDTQRNNCFYIGGPNGSGKSALFASMNIGLGGRGNNNDRGNSVKMYIKDGRSKARIRLILTNRGLSSHPDFGDFVVVERTITSSCSTYVLKSIAGTDGNETEMVVSKKKADLDQLLMRYGIQINNPIFWMTQDRSRHFLHQMKPERLFQIFMCATELEHTKACYEQCEVIIAGVEALCKSMKEELEKMRRRCQAMVEERQRLRILQDMRKEQNDIGWMLLWCPLRDALQAIGKVRERREKLEKELEHVGKRIDETAQRKNDCVVKASSVRSKIDVESDSLTKLKELISEKKSAISNVNNEIVVEKTKRMRLERSRISYEERRDRLNEKMAKFKEESQCEMRKQEASQTKIRLDEITEEESKVIERLRLVQQERDQLQKGLEHSSFSNDKVVRESHEILGKIKDLEQEINRCEMTTKNAVIRFGENVPKILEILEANADKFEYSPRGPIGMHVKMRDRNWTFAVEEATRRLLSSFVFNSKRDHQVFERIMRTNGLAGALPNAIFAKFDVLPHDVSSNEPSSEWDTILRVIEVNDIVIRNVLIDMASVEGTILLKTDEDARRIMDGMCPDKCVRAFTASGGMAMGRNRRGEGFYRFYACRGAPRAMFLSDQAVNADIVTLKAELSRLRDESARVKDDVKKAASELTSTQRKYGKALQDYIAVENELNSLRSLYRSLERRLEQLQMEDDCSILDNMRASLDEINGQIGELNDELAKLDEALSQKQEKLLEFKKECEEVEPLFVKTKDNVALLQNQLEDINEKIRRLDVATESVVQRQESIRESVAELDIKVNELEGKRVEALETAERSKELPTPSSMSIPPDMGQLDDTAKLQEMYEALTLKIAAAEKVIGNTVTSEELQSFKANYEEAKKQYLVLKGLNKKLSECLVIRKEKFPIMCHAITMRLKVAFQRLMATRSYHGNLIVDRQNGLININVATHQKDQYSHPVANVVQDLRGLSGGERSFTTACFIMALWEIMEAPFRCMDEFDVFMDMINRRVVMDLLVKLATEQYSHNQFIFFTPQGIKELGEREQVQVFEMPKVRQ